MLASWFFSRSCAEIIPTNTEPKSRNQLRRQVLHVSKILLYLNDRARPHNIVQNAHAYLHNVENFTYLTGVGPTGLTASEEYGVIGRELGIGVSVEDDEFRNHDTE